MKFLKKLTTVPNKIFCFFIFIYQKILSPATGIFRFIPFYPKPSCIFYPTCSQYSMECFKKYSFPRALNKTITRISRCHPGNSPQVDLP